MKTRTLAALAAPLGLAACIGPFARTAPYAYDKKGDLVEFNYAWSAEVSATPRLRRQLRADLEHSFDRAASMAQADRERATASNQPFLPHRYSRRWTTAGQSAKLLSLDGRKATFTGGAHPNPGANGLLWDRRQSTEIRPDHLFTAQNSLDTLVRDPGCAMLASERARRLGASVRAGDVVYDCPTVGTAIVPSDSNHNRRFDHFRLIAAGGVAGAYVEGTYDVSVPITATLLAAIKPAWRTEFEVAQPQ